MRIISRSSSVVVSELPYLAVHFNPRYSKHVSFCQHQYSTLVHILKVIFCFRWFVVTRNGCFGYSSIESSRQQFIIKHLIRFVYTLSLSHVTDNTNSTNSNMIMTAASNPKSARADTPT